MTSMKNLILEVARTKPVLNAIARIDKLKELNQKMFDMGMSRPTRDWKMREFKDLIKAELIKESISETDRLNNELEKMQAAYQIKKEAGMTGHLQQLGLFQTKLTASTDEELTEKAHAYMAGLADRIIDPDALDCLAAEVKNRGMAEYIGLKQAMKENQYEKPWIAEGKGQEIYSELMAWRRARPGEFAVKFEEGLAVLSIDDLYDVEPEMHDAAV
jgi:hypothetical protein